ncbi:hypothetical protein QA601_07990 [Chitinispirillales bacterium ANBcel5]|uniref:hypothetical protein n=1 Tax=Cellulosispirillum alkaliphilum TaxID=3039283 RepID=UPI002A52F368|nr:hypothetical protein [Chitinispirillales bacterium ANBcel5]
MFIIIPFVASVVAFTISSLLEETFYTEIRLRIDDPNSNQMSIFADVGKSLSNYFGDAFKDESKELYMEILSGRENLISAIKEFELDTLYNRRAMELTLEDFKDNLFIGSRSNGIIICGFEGSDRQLALELVTFMVNRANEKFLQLQRERLLLNTEFLAQKRDELLDTLDTLNEELILFYRDNNVINIRKQIELSLLALSSYEEQLNSLRLSKSYSSSAVGKNAPMSRELENKIRVLEREFRTLRGNFSDDYTPSRQSVLINTDWGLEKMLYERILTTRVGFVEEILVLLSKELALSESQLSRDIPVIQVVQEAYIPDWKVAPKRSVWIIVAFSIAFLGTVSYVLFSAFLKGELKCSSEENRQRVKALIEALKK